MYRRANRGQHLPLALYNMAWIANVNARGQFHSCARLTTSSRFTRRACV
jgi:hypothetical protein